MSDVVVVFVASLATALACGLGALPLLVVRDVGRTVLGGSNAVAAGVMVAASVALALQGIGLNSLKTAAGVIAGVLFILVLRRRLRQDHHVVIGSLRGDDALKALMIVGVMTVHSVAEGVGVGAAFGEGATLGVLIAVAIAVHNVPEGLAIALVLVPRGVSIPMAAWWGVFSSLPQPLLAVPAFLFVDAFADVLPVALGFAAGAMVWMAARELVPEALEQTTPRVAISAGVIAFAAMMAFQLVLL